MFLIITLYHLSFMHILCHLRGSISGSNMFALILSYIVSVYFSYKDGHALFYM